MGILFLLPAGKGGNHGSGPAPDRALLLQNAAVTEEPLPLSEEASIRLQQYPGVQTVALGPKETGGELTDRLAVLVLVRRKLPLAELTPQEVIPTEIEGLLTDVVEIDFHSHRATRFGG